MSKKVSRNGKKPTVESIFADILALPLKEQFSLWEKLKTADLANMNMFQFEDVFIERLNFDLQKARTDKGKKKTSLTDEDWEILIDKELLSWSEMKARHGGTLTSLRQRHKRAERLFREQFMDQIFEPDRKQNKIIFRPIAPTAPAGKERAEMYARYRFKEQHPIEAFNQDPLGRMLKPYTCTS
jgi:hypothetical protein